MGEPRVPLFDYQGRLKPRGGSFFKSTLGSQKV